MNIFIFAMGFAVIALASKQIGLYFVKASLPLISGFLFAGILVGPYVLNLITLEAVENLRFVDEVSLAFIAFAAGNELYLKDLKDRFKSIQWVGTSLVASTFTLGSLAAFFLSEFIPFMQTMPATGRVAVSILAGSILVARSPSSAIAVINELRAKGPFTKTVLGVTVMTDVVVITLFAVNISIADALLTGLSFDIRFILLLLIELSLSILLGYILGKVFMIVLSFRVNSKIKTVLILTAGYGIYILSAGIRHTSHNHLPFDILVEPLLICMIGGFIVTNYCKCRMEFSKILYDTGPPVFIAFFTLTGASLTLDVLITTWPIALVLFFVRCGTIFVGSFTGGVLAGDPMKYNRVSWMAYITQAGVGLGLAKAVVVEFPEWGVPFATIIIAVIVLNQVVGPPLLKRAISLTGEDHSRAEGPELYDTREAIIFGLESQSMALAHLLKSNGWEVKIAATGINQKDIEDSKVEICPIPDLTQNALNQINAGQAEAIITMMSDDENYHICELAYENFGTSILVVRLNNQADFKRFHELGALVVDPGTAIVHLLDQFVRSPSAASLLLGMEENQNVLELELRNPNLHGLALRDLRLPLNTIILSVRRHGQMLISHGYTRLKVGDWVTIVGPPESLKEVELRFDVNREHALAYLVEKITAKELLSDSLETEVKEIIRGKNTAADQSKQPKDRFDRFIEESVVIDIHHRTGVKKLFGTIADALSSPLKIDPDILYNLLMEREKESSTAISQGLAIPHIIIEGTHKFNIMLARCREGILFSESAPMVYAVFVLAGTKDERNFHLQALSAIAQIVQNPNFEKQWLRARNENALRNVVLTANRKRSL